MTLWRKSGYWKLQYKANGVKGMEKRHYGEFRGEVNLP